MQEGRQDGKQQETLEGREDRREHKREEGWKEDRHRTELGYICFGVPMCFSLICPAIEVCREDRLQGLGGAA